MEILIILTVGIFIGAKFFPLKLKKWNEKLQIILIAILIFAMGISLGSREDFINELFTLGLDSLILALIPMSISALLVYILTKKTFEKNK
jgi:uncharacterized membrane protein YbjE (DUF340 family)